MCIRKYLYQSEWGEYKWSRLRLSFINKNLGIDKAMKGSTLLANELESKIKVENDSISTGFTGRSTLMEKSRDVFFMFAPMIDILTTERY